MQATFYNVPGTESFTANLSPDKNCCDLPNTECGFFWEWKDPIFVTRFGKYYPSIRIKHLTSYGFTRWNNLPVVKPTLYSPFEGNFVVDNVLYTVPWMECLVQLKPDRFFYFDGNSRIVADSEGFLIYKR